MYINHLDDIVNKYNNTYHSTIKIKHVHVNASTYINFSTKNKEDAKFKVSDNVRISKYKNIFPKCYTTNWSEEVFLIKKVKNAMPWTYVINDLNGKVFFLTFSEKELEKTNKKEFRIEKAIKKKVDKLENKN